MSSSGKPLLYQMAVSHYCEKARWALDYKGVAFEARNLLPGPHAKTAKKLSGKTQLPILKYGDDVVSNSSDILDYIDLKFPQQALMPEIESRQQEVRHWEKFADDELGADVRRVCYFTLLDNKDSLIGMLSQQGPWYGRLLLSTIYPKLKEIMAKTMKVTAEETAKSQENVIKAVSKLGQELAGKRYLVGEQFTRADLAVSALLAPLCQPPEYPVIWPSEKIEPLATFQAELADQLEFVRENYRVHRSSPV